MVLLAAVTPSGAQESVDVKVIVGAGCGTVLDVALHAQPAMGVAVGLGVMPAAATEGKLFSSSFTCMPVKFHDPAMCTVLDVAMHVQLAMSIAIGLGVAATQRFQTLHHQQCRQEE